MLLSPSSLRISISDSVAFSDPEDGVLGVLAWTFLSFFVINESTGRGMALVSSSLLPPYISL